MCSGLKAGKKEVQKDIRDSSGIQSLQKKKGLGVTSAPEKYDSRVYGIGTSTNSTASFRESGEPTDNQHHQEELGFR